MTTAGSDLRHGADALAPVSPATTLPDSDTSASSSSSFIRPAPSDQMDIAYHASQSFERHNLPVTDMERSTPSGWSFNRKLSPSQSPAHSRSFTIPQCQPIKEDIPHLIPNSCKSPVTVSPEHTGQTSTNGSLVSSAQTSLPPPPSQQQQQPKVVQTAFIHKLYNMLEDQSIQHLISWSSSNESFFMSPSSEFSKVLSSYFKHTNISSFVRQLNMYGFHKISDVYHSGNSDAPLWEFKHGNGNFKRGDLLGLREIKRRASRHALIHKDSFSNNAKNCAHQTNVPSSTTNHDPILARLTSLEQHFELRMFDLHTQLSRSQDMHATLTNKCQVLTDSLVKSLQWNHELANSILSLIPDTDNPLRRDVLNIQSKLMQQVDVINSSEETLDSPSAERMPLFLLNRKKTHSRSPSPRKTSVDHSVQRRVSYSTLPGSPYRQSPAFSSAGLPSNRYGCPTPNSHRSVSQLINSPVATQSLSLPPPAPSCQSSSMPLHTMPYAARPPSPLASISRRHTSADIRLQGRNSNLQQPQQQSPRQPQPPQPFHLRPQPLGSRPQAHAPTPFYPGANSSKWPSSPNLRHLALKGGGGGGGSGNHTDRDIRDTLASYELPRTPSRGCRRFVIDKDARSLYNTNLALTSGTATSPNPNAPNTASTGGNATENGLGSSVSATGDNGRLLFNEAVNWQLPVSRFPQSCVDVNDKSDNGNNNLSSTSTTGTGSVSNGLGVSCGTDNNCNTTTTTSSGPGAVAAAFSPIRRSSMASTVHALLNPTDTGDSVSRDDQETGAKRKRVL